MSDLDELGEDALPAPAAAQDQADQAPADPGDPRPLLDELLAAPTRPREPASGPQTRVGWFVEWRAGEAPTVDFPGNERGPLPARSIVPLDPTTIAAAIQSERGVLLTFEDGRPDAPIITGLLQDLFGEANEPQIWVESEDDEDAEQDVTQAQPGADLAQTEARVDGKRIEFEAADEIVLRCGQASIVLRRNGRVVIRGTYVESRSRGVNRIKGGSVQIN